MRTSMVVRSNKDVRVWMFVVGFYSKSLLVKFSWVGERFMHMECESRSWEGLKTTYNGCNRFIGRMAMAFCYRCYAVLI
jgi:hypothetical protein